MHRPRPRECGSCFALHDGQHRVRLTHAVNARLHEVSARRCRLCRCRSIRRQPTAGGHTELERAEANEYCRGSLGLVALALVLLGCGNVRDKRQRSAHMNLATIRSGWIECLRARSRTPIDPVPSRRRLGDEAWLHEDSGRVASDQSCNAAELPRWQTLPDGIEKLDAYLNHARACGSLGARTGSRTGDAKHGSHG